MLPSLISFSFRLFPNTVPSELQVHVAHPRIAASTLEQECKHPRHSLFHRPPDFYPGVSRAPVVDPSNRQPVTHAQCFRFVFSAIPLLPLLLYPHHYPPTTSLSLSPLQSQHSEPYLNIDLFFPPSPLPYTCSANVLLRI